VFYFAWIWSEKQRAINAKKVNAVDPSLGILIC